MEIVIVICLLIVIALLLHDKYAAKRKTSVAPRKGNEESLLLPDIMGKPKSTQGQPGSITATGGQSGIAPEGPGNFIPETDETVFETGIPQEEPEEVLVEPDWEEEEEEWARHGEPNGEDGFATGVTFDELSTVGLVLRQDEPEPALKEQAVGIVQKIQGTELLQLLESSMENAAQKIAKLLDESIPAGTDTGSSTMRNNKPDDFDIGAFV